MFIVFIILVFLSTNANAYSLIRDAEMEITLQEYFNPVFKVSGVKPNIYIINNPELNAFVAGGQNIFINTGLILKSDTPEMLIGVIAHETAHITGGHLITHKKEAKAVRAKAILGYLLGALAVAGGGGDAGVAVMTASSSYATGQFMAYSRTTEQIADRAAVEFLNKAKISPQGLVDMFELLRREEKKHPDMTPYLRSHPLTTERITNLRSYANNSATPKPQKKFEKIKVKLAAFLGEPYTPKIKVPCFDYCRQAITLYRMGKTDESIKVMDYIIAKYQKNSPFAYELKGQILYESGRNDEAIKAYQKAFDLLPHPLIRYGLGVAQVGSNNKKVVKKGVDNINSAIAVDKGLGSAYYYLATGYKKLGNEGKTLLSLAENELIMDNKDKAFAYAQKALKILPSHSPSYIRAKDILLDKEEDDD